MYKLEAEIWTGYTRSNLAALLLAHTHQAAALVSLLSYYLVTSRFHCTKLSQIYIEMVPTRELGRRSGKFTRGEIVGKLAEDNRGWDDVALPEHAAELVCPALL